MRCLGRAVKFGDIRTADKDLALTGQNHGANAVVILQRGDKIGKLAAQSQAKRIDRRIGDG